MQGLNSVTDIVAARSRAASVGPETHVGFADVLDALNPLQHIPVVSWAYRALTGDAISNAAKLVGGTLFGGPIGFALAAVGTVWERATGTDLGGAVVAWSKGNNRSTTEQSSPLIAEAVRAPQSTGPGAAHERAILTADAEEVAAPERVSGPIPGPTAGPTPGPAWELAAANLPQDEVDLLLRSVGLAGTNAGSVNPKSAREPVMPAVPVAPVGVIALAEADPMPPAYRQVELSAALAASQELRRAYGRF